MKRAKTLSSNCFFSIWTIAASALTLFSLGCASQESATNVPPVPQVTAKSSAPMSPTVKMQNDYYIGPGDVLEISVWKNEDLSRVVVVLPDGTITFPLLGRLFAGGKTVDQLREEMEIKISRYVPEPGLTVIIQQVNSMVVYVIGKVNRPGHFPLKSNIDVLQALSMAGGLNIFANPTDIRIFRKTAGKTSVLAFDYDRLTEDNYLKENVLLKAGDVVVVK